MFFKKPIYVIGDLHGHFKSLQEQIMRYDLEGCVIMIAGDCGIGFSPVEVLEESLLDLKNLCERVDIDVLFLRGNHDNPRFFNGVVPFKYGKLQCIPDYSVLNNEILCVGGGISIDRLMRKKENETYWEDEQPYFDETFFKNVYDAGIKIRHVVSHICPSICVPMHNANIYHWLKNDAELENDIKNSNNVMDKILDALREQNHPLESWTYGHYHFHKNDYIIIDGFDSDVKFTLLSAILHSKDIPDMIELKNTLGTS